MLHMPPMSYMLCQSGRRMAGSGKARVGCAPPTAADRHTPGAGDKDTPTWCALKGCEAIMCCTILQVISRQEASAARPPTQLFAHRPARCPRPARHRRALHLAPRRQCQLSLESTATGCGESDETVALCREPKNVVPRRRCAWREGVSHTAPRLAPTGI